MDTGLQELYLPLLVTGIHCTVWWVWKDISFHTYWVILFETTRVKTCFAPLFNQSEKRNGVLTCEQNGSTNHSAPTKSNRVFGSFVFSLKVLFWQLCQKVKTFRFLVWITSQENCQKKLNNCWRRKPSLSRNPLTNLSRNRKTNKRCRKLDEILACSPSFWNPSKKTEKYKRYNHRN